MSKAYPTTPDGRYFVVRGRLWRCSNPALAEDVRQAAVDRLMQARRDVAKAKKFDDADALADARTRVQSAKEALGERGAPWWRDGAPDFNRRLVRNTPYAGWFETLST